jgi:hypothetical protein
LNVLSQLWPPPNQRTRLLYTFGAVAVGLAVLVAAWNLSAPPEKEATVRENAGPPILTTRTEALDEAEARIGYRPLVPDFPAAGLTLTDVRLTMPPASNARYPRTQLDFRSDDGSGSRLFLVAQGREDWLPNRSGWVTIDLGIPGVETIRAGASASDGSLEYRLRVGEWRYAVLFFGPSPPLHEIEDMLRHVAHELQTAHPPD